MKLQLSILFVVLSLTSTSGLVEEDTTSNSIENETDSSELEISNRIFGGLTAARDDYNYVARLLISYKSWTSEVCSGVVLTTKIIITVAHCVERPGGDSARLVRATLPRGGWYSFNSQEIIVRRPAESRDPDIAILRKNTAGSIFFRNFGTVPVLLEETQDITVTPGPAKIAGWGRTANSPLYSPRLQFATVNIVDTATCQKNYPETAPAIGPNGLICTETSVSGTCAGDWGGPLLVDSADKKNGIVLRGLSLSRRGSTCDNSSPVPSAFINLQSIGNWLKTSFPELASLFVKA